MHIRYNADTTAMSLVRDIEFNLAYNDFLMSLPETAKQYNHHTTVQGPIAATIPTIINGTINAVEKIADRPLWSYNAMVVNQSFTNEQLLSINDDAIEVTYYAEANNMARLRIFIIKRGTTMIQRVKEYRAPTQQETNIEIMLQQNATHKFVVRRRGTSITVMSNQELSIATLRKLYLMPYLYWEDLEKYPLAKALVTAAFEENEAAMTAACSAIFNKWKANQQEYCYTALADAMRNRTAGDISAIEQEITNCNNSIEVILKDFERMQNQRTALQQRLNGAKLEPAKADDACIAFLRKNKGCTLTQVVNNRMVLDIVTPLKSFADRDVAMYFRYPDRLNSVTQYRDTEKIIRACFLDKTHTLICGTRVYMPLSGNTNGWPAPHDVPGYMGNPHMTHFNCFSATRIAINKTIVKNNDYLTAINMLIAACATIVFTDGAVISAFSRDLHSMDDTIKVFKDNATNELCSKRELLQKIQDTANNKRDEVEEHETTDVL